MAKKIFSVLMIALLLVGGISTAGVTPAQAQDGADCADTYTVQADDWLSKIADRFLGNVLAYPAIVDATNAAAAADDSFAAILDANLIDAGQKNVHNC